MSMAATCRWYGNFLATDNRALAPADFTGSASPPSDELPGTMVIR
jgi:hypothetical protein